MKHRTTLRAAFVVTYALQAAPAHADPPNGPRCPAQSPAEGGACADAGLECGYRPCGEYNTLRATCDGATRRWTVVEVTCNPPPPPPARNPPAPRR